MGCEQKIKNKFIKICFIGLILQMLVVIGFSHKTYAQNDTSHMQDIAQVAPADSIKKVSVAPTQKIDKPIGKLPFKQSQLPELIVAICILSVLAILRYFFPRYIPELTQQYFNFYADARVLKNDRIGQLLPGIFYDIFYVIFATAFILLYAKYVNANSAVFTTKRFILVAAILAFYLIVKYYLFTIITWVFKFTNTSNIVMCYTIITRHVLCLLLFPVVCLLMLISNVIVLKLVIITTIVIGIILYIFHLLKMLVFVKKTSSVSFFDIFIYLCSAEILINLLLIVFVCRQIHI